jgi:hypothetical protein
LSDVAGLGRSGEMFLAGQSRKILQLPDIHGATIA